MKKSTQNYAQGGLPLSCFENDLKNMDLCWFCGEGSAKMKIYFCDGYCMRGFCGRCLELAGELPHSQDRHDRWLCPQCRNNLGTCVFCNRTSLVWQPTKHLVLNINLDQIPATEKEREIRQNYVFRCFKRNCPTMFHLDCIPREKVTLKHICYSRAKATKENYFTSTSRKSKGVEYTIEGGKHNSTREEIVYRWYCPRHECDCQDCLEAIAKNTEPQKRSFRVDAKYNRRHIYCLRCPRMMHALCATSESWTPLPNTERLALCNHHSPRELTIPKEYIKFSGVDETVGPPPAWVSMWYESPLTPRSCFSGNEIITTSPKNTTQLRDVILQFFSAATDVSRIIGTVDYDVLLLMRQELEKARKAVREKLLEKKEE